VERACRKVRLARLIHAAARVLGGPAVRAAFGGDPSRPWLPRRVVAQRTAFLAHMAAGILCNPLTPQPPPLSVKFDLVCREGWSAACRY
jgi:hypothetical protein